MTSEHSVVKLVIYDLSQGMARQLGPMLGVHLEYLPHTGVIVFGQEYFFGGGIQRMRHELVVAQFGLRPFRQDTLGTTSRSADELHAYLRTLDSQFHQSTYDLFHNNCNHFSDTIVKFLLGGTGIPSEIVDLPRRVLSTPMGQMLAPAWSAMQQRMQQELVPFNSAGTGSGSIPPPAVPATAAPVLPRSGGSNIKPLPLVEALKLLEGECSSTEYLVALETLLKISRNILGSPMEPKFRRLPRANEKFQNTLGRFPHGIPCLHSLSFESDATDAFLVLDPDAAKWERLVLAEKVLSAARKRVLKSIIDKSGAKTRESAIHAVGEDRKDDSTVKELLDSMFA